ncbi:glycosyltransferase family 25 protein [Rhizobium lemnae]|uniref:Glycosyltransferase family 25 protein n=1 Tax=Rhizobium lemnae TaxID=1214924 RepID=A0ABV8E4V0_9HYPH|nr:glycosyltransferase family 25 protein [Rhizobium lemnae]MCJ8506661.1 glycosyltransferase family 25 protein [Rhizobium lemnae]
MSMVVSFPGTVNSASGGRPLGLFAINLDRSPDRWRQIEAGFGSLPWPLQRIAGIDARLDPAAVLAVRRLPLRVPPHALGWNAHRNRLFMLTEEACLAGHILAWRTFLESDFDHGIVLEDDAMPQQGFEAAIEALLRQGFDVDIVKLEGIYRPGARKALRLGNAGDRVLVRSLRPCSGAAAYMLTRKAAQRLLDRIGDVLLPADDFLWAPSWHGLKIADLSPWVVMQSGAASVIATDRAAKKADRVPPPGRNVWMAVRRGLERLLLLWSATDGKPWKMANAALAQWAPNDYIKMNSQAVTAEDRRSKNG